MWQPHLTVLTTHYRITGTRSLGCAGSVAAGPFTMEAATALVQCLRARSHGPAHVVDCRLEQWSGITALSSMHQS